MADLGGDGVRQAVAVAAAGALPGEPLEGLLGALLPVRLARVLVAQLVEREAAAGDDLQGAGDRVRVALEQARHLAGILEVAVGMALEAQAGGIDGGLQPDAGDHVLQHAAGGVVVEDVAHRDRRHPGGVGRLLHRPEPQVLVGGEAADQGHVAAVAEGGLEPLQVGREALVSLVPEQDGKQALAPGRHVLPGEVALALADIPLVPPCLAGPALAEAEQPAQAGVGSAGRSGRRGARCRRSGRAGSRPPAARRFPSRPHGRARSRRASCGR